MKVKDLIAELNKQDPNKEIKLCYPTGETIDNAEYGKCEICEYLKVDNVSEQAYEDVEGDEREVVIILVSKDNLEVEPEQEVAVFTYVEQ